MPEKKGYEGCEICGKELLLFKCKYCGKAFCEHHKAPEMHECAGLAEYRRLLSMGVIARPGGTAASAEKTGAPPVAAKDPRIATLYKRSVYAVKLLSVVAVALAAIFTLILLISYINANMPAGPYTIPVSNATGATVVLINNKTATNPTWDSLMAFLKADNTIKIKYDFPSFTCADFARTLHDKAEASGIRCGFVAIEFDNQTVNYSIYNNSNDFHPPTSSPVTSHGLNVFNTVDRGLVYVDASSDKDYAGSDAKVRIAYLVEDQELNEIDLDWATDTSYSFYESYKRTQLDFIADQRAYYANWNAFSLQMSDNGYIMTPELKAENDQLNLQAVELNARKSRIGPFYYPIGIVKKIDLFW